MTALMNDQTEDELRGKQLVFLVGAPRSGTTWLQLLLSRSPSVATVQETHLFNLFLRPIVDKWNLDRLTGEQVGLTQVLSDEEFRAMLRGASGFVFAKIAQSKPSATVILEKTPNHVNCWREILDVWPEAHFVHLIRDPRSVVASLRVASRSWARQWASSRITPNCERWIIAVTNGRQIGSATQNYQEIFYQDLISDGPQVVMRILSRWGISVSLDECRRYVDECSIENLKAGKLKNAPYNVATMGRESFRIGTNDSWRIELSTPEIGVVERLARVLMVELGYKPVNNSGTIAVLADVLCTVKNAVRVAKRQLRSGRERL